MRKTYRSKNPPVLRRKIAEMLRVELHAERFQKEEKSFDAGVEWLGCGGCRGADKLSGPWR